MQTAQDGSWAANGRLEMRRTDHILQMYNGGVCSRGQPAIGVGRNYGEDIITPLALAPDGRRMAVILPGGQWPTPLRSDGIGSMVDYPARGHKIKVTVQSVDTADDKAEPADVCSVEVPNWGTLYGLRWGARPGPSSVTCWLLPSMLRMRPMKVSPA